MSASESASFHALLRQFRLACGLSQEALAIRAGLSPDTVRALERGRRNTPRPSTIVLLAGALELSPVNHEAFLLASRPSLREELSTAPAPAAPLTPVIRSPPPDAFIGRERELAEIASLFEQAGVRLVTLLGPGGVGKTRLALEYLARAGRAARFIDLSSIHDAEFVPTTIAQGIGAEDSEPTEPWPRLHDKLRACEDLIVLDNFEQVIDAAPAIGRLLAACPGVRMLVTSRMPLRLRGEQRYDLAPLPVDAEGDDMLGAAVRLFIARARAVNPHLSLNNEALRAIAAICARLDGLPLAIELATAKSLFLPPLALLDRLDQRLPLLTSGSRDAPDRHQTMRAAIDWSFSLLPSSEQAIFARLAIFSGGFTADAARSIALHGSIVDDPLPHLQSLIDQGLIRPALDALGEPRLHILETTREYGLEQLLARGEAGAARAAHAAWFLCAARMAEPGLKGPESERWFHLVEADIANYRAALDWFQEQGKIETALELAIGIAWFWTAPNYVAEGRDRFERLLALAGEGVNPVTMAEALDTTGMFADWQTDSERAIACYEAALAMWRQSGDLARTANALRGLGSALLDHLDFPRAEALLTEARELAIAAGDNWNVAAAANLLGLARRCQGDPEAAVRWHQEALACWRVLGDGPHIPIALGALGVAHLLAGALHHAWTDFDASLAIFVTGEPSLEMALAVGAMGAIAIRGNDATTAATLYSAATRLRGLVDLPFRPSTQRLFDCWIDEARATMGAVAFARSWELGQSLDVAAMVQLARSVPPPGANCAHRHLSRRESEVLCLLVDGAEDQEIANRLAITRRTASKHVASILQKLDAPNRTAAAAIALRRGLV